MQPMGGKRVDARLVRLPLFPACATHTRRRRPAAAPEAAMPTRPPAAVARARVRSTLSRLWSRQAVRDAVSASTGTGRRVDGLPRFPRLLGAERPLLPAVAGAVAQPLESAGVHAGLESLGQFDQHRGLPSPRPLRLRRLRAVLRHDDLGRRRTPGVARVARIEVRDQVVGLLRARSCGRRVHRAHAPPRQAERPRRDARRGQQLAQHRLRRRQVSHPCSDHAVNALTGVSSAVLVVCCSVSSVSIIVLSLVNENGREAASSTHRAAATPELRTHYHYQ
eukprot:scaffold12757_cov116-Isochrysis_galbana.AAC.2